MKGIALYALGFGLLLAAALYLGNADVITPAVVEARAEVTAGPVMMGVVNEGLAFLLKLITGATVAGLVGAAFVEGRKVYRMWWREKNLRRGPMPSTGPAGTYGGTRLPKLTREDLILLALGEGQRHGRGPGSARGPLRSTQNEGQSDEEIDLDF